MSDCGPSSRRTTTAASKGAPARRTAECGLRAGRARWHGWTAPNCSTATSSSSAWCCPSGQPRTVGCFGGTTASAGCCSTTLSVGVGTTCSTAGTPPTDSWTTNDLRTPSRRASGSCARVTHCCAGSMRSHCDGVASRRRPPAGSAARQGRRRTAEGGSGTHRHRQPAADGCRAQPRRSGRRGRQHHERAFGVGAPGRYGQDSRVCGDDDSAERCVRPGTGR